MNRYSEETIELFHALLRSAISTGEAVRLPESEEIIRTVLALGKAQNVLLLICYGIEKNDGITLKPVLTSKLLTTNSLVI